MAGTDGKTEEGWVVVKISAVEACPITVTCKLKKSMRKKPPFLRWLVMDCPATGPNANTSVPTTRQLNRSHRSVSYPVSENGRNQEPPANTGFLGWSIGNRSTCRFLFRGSTHFFLSQVVEMTGMGKTFIYSRISDGTFPKQIQLGSRSVVWNERDVIDWINQQIATAT